MTIDWTGVVALLGALLTLFASILALLPLVVNRTENITAPLDPKIKALEIKRNALKPEDWVERRRRIRYSYIYIIIFFAFIVIIYIIAFSAFSFLPALSHLNPFLLLILFFIYPLVTILISLRGLYLRSLSELRFKDAEAAKYYIFESVEIEVNGDLEDIFSKAQEALRGKKGYPIDINSDAKTLDMWLKGSYIVNKAPVKIDVEIKPNTRNVKNYSLAIKYGRERNLPKDLKAKDLKKSDYFRDIDTYSAFANQFIGLLLTMEAPSGNK